ncbi:ribonuclease HII [Candidatus Falkowbacteria bacterium HGW-Falkowbacteria-2]|uniref:Ribonuclease HII n=1 Tax=Candidatus Falkowbacteria bacterium HGW-Falkowbacteria-2 TaxID=2013769 RepID=A0A2N2DX88_9BACT|nr:MAG: ribonuclease HII [Candidatus Falkowbacteria bacterium HGW-Falkowbacteria-2]
MLDLEFEQNIFNQGFRLIGGLDEAGRGPLAGPVVAACVVIGPDFSIDTDELRLVADSKKLTAKCREKLFSVIKQKALAVEISVVNNHAIDRINILQSTLSAMQQAINKLTIKPDYILVDGNAKVPGLDITQQTVIDGDAKIFVIAAASIIAKVSRDWLMAEADKQFPEYEFGKHKGYGTKRHMEKIKEFGPCPIHRLSFAPFKQKEKSASN